MALVPTDKREDRLLERLTLAEERAALATEHGLYAPSDSVHWRSLFFDTLWRFIYKVAGFRQQVMLEGRRYMKKLTDY